MGRHLRKEGKKVNGRSGIEPGVSSPFEGGDHKNVSRVIQSVMEIFHEDVANEGRAVNVIRVGTVDGMKVLEADCKKGVTGGPIGCMSRVRGLVYCLKKRCDLGGWSVSG